MVQTKQNYSIFLYAIIVGIVGGITTLFLLTFSYYFHFITISPKFLLRFFDESVRSMWLDIAFLVIIFIVGSIVAAIVYTLILKKKRQYYWGLYYGVFLFLFTFGLIHPIIFSEPWIYTEGAATVITLFCLFVLYGIFIGYSISYEYEEFEQGFGEI